eukprot:Skav203009  [mRNA]  locus=scaffold6029:6369:7211:- [translate_table: standard]
MRLQMADTFKPLLQALGRSDDELLSLANQLGLAKGLTAPFPTLADMGTFLLSQMRVGLTVYRDEKKPEPLLRPADNIPWLVELARAELQKVSFRELIVLLYIFLPQLSYQAVHPSVEVKADTFSMVGIVATTFPEGMPAKLRPYALGPADIHEFYLDFHDNADLPALFALPQVGARILADLPEADPDRKNQRYYRLLDEFTTNRTSFQAGANSGDAVLVTFSVPSEPTSADAYTALFLVLEQEQYRTKSNQAPELRAFNGSRAYRWKVAHVPRQRTLRTA